MTDVWVNQSLNADPGHRQLGQSGHRAPSASKDLNPGGDAVPYVNALRRTGLVIIRKAVHTIRDGYTH